MFETVEELSEKLSETGYFVDPTMTKVVFLAARMQKPLLLEGPAGSGKTQLALAVAQAAGTHVERLQCYSGVTSDQAIGQFDDSLQRLYMEYSKAQSGSWQELQASLKGRDFFRAGPLMRALESDKPCVLLIDELDIREAVAANRGNRSLMSLMMHRLLLYPDHPFDIGKIWGKRFNPQTKHYESFLVTEAPELAKDVVYPKERSLIEDIRTELRQGRRCQVHATFTGEFDVAARLESVLRGAGIRVSVLRPSVPTLRRELWYEKQLKEGVEVVICHPKLVETGLDLLAFPTLYFYETGYSLHTLRQASRRSWRIGQKHPVHVKFLVTKGTTQATCLRLMGKKMLVALMMEGKFSGEGIHSLESDDDMMSAMARELVERGRVGASADAIWADLKRERALHMPARPASKPEQDTDTDQDVPEMALFLPHPAPDAQPALALVHPTGQPKHKPSSLWPTGHDEGAQMLLFA